MANAHDRINVSNNPVNFVDPLGLDPFSATIISTGMSSGIGVGAAGYAQSQANQQMADAFWATSTLNPAAYLNVLNWLSDSVSDETSDNEQCPQERDLGAKWDDFKESPDDWEKLDEKDDPR